MSNTVINPYQQFRDATGNPVENGTLTFYVNETTTLDTIYSDEALTIPQANPYTLDAVGRMTGDVRYLGKKRMVLRDEAGATIRTLDHVTTASDTDATLSDYDKRYATLALLLAGITSADIGKTFVTTEYATGRGYESGNSYIVEAHDAGNTYDTGELLRGTADTSVCVRALFKNGVSLSQFGVQAPWFLPITSDIINDITVSILNFIPRTLHVAVRDKTTAIDVAAYLQDALDNANKLYAPKGLYIVGTELTKTHDTPQTQGLILTGDGMEETIFDNRVASGALLKIEQDASGDFAYGAELSHFKITTTTSPASSNGLEIQASSLFKIDSLSIGSLTGTGIEMIGDTDPDQNTLFEILRCHITNMGNRGINAAYVASNTLAMYRIAHNRIISCANAGMRLVFANAEVVNNTFALNGSTAEAQLLVHQPGATNYGMSICRNFFEKGRSGELEIEAAIAGEVKLNTFSSNDASSGAFAVKLGHHVSGNTRGIELKGNRHVVNSTIAGTYTCYDFGDRASKCDLIKPEYNDISTATKVAMTVTAKAASNYIEDSNGIVVIPKSRRYEIVTVSSAGTTTLDYLSSGPAQRVNLGATGAHTLDAPIASEGNELDLIVRNQSGGAVNVTFGARFTGITGYTDPANGAQTSCKFVYDDVSAAFRQVGAWSA